MATEWGNGDNTVHDADMISANGNILKVTDIADDAKVALAVSNKDGASSVAIEAEGQVKVTAVSDSNPARPD